MHSSATGFLKKGQDTSRGAELRQAQRDLLVQATVVDAIFDEVLHTLSATKCEEIRAEMARNRAFAVIMKRAVINIGLVLSFAKTLLVEEEFGDAVKLLSGTHFTAKGGLVGAFAKAMVRLDMDNAQDPEAFHMFEFVDREALNDRWDQLLLYIDLAIQHPQEPPKA